MKVIMKDLTKIILKDQTDKTRIQLIRYVIVGAVAFLIDFSALYILTEFFGIFYLVSAAIGFILGLLVNYFLSVSWVFNNRKLENRKFEFGIFAIIGMVGLVLNEVFIWFFTQDLLIFYLYSKILAGVVILLWNFFARKFMLF
jgi:putative flippase GtrA